MATIQKELMTEIDLSELPWKPVLQFHFSEPVSVVNKRAASVPEIKRQKGLCSCSCTATGGLTGWQIPFTWRAESQWCNRSRNELLWGKPHPPSDSLTLPLTQACWVWMRPPVKDSMGCLGNSSFQLFWRTGSLPGWKTHPWSVWLRCKLSKRHWGCLDESKGGPFTHLGLLSSFLTRQATLGILLSEIVLRDLVWGDRGEQGHFGAVCQPPKLREVT